MYSTLTCNPRSIGLFYGWRTVYFVKQILRHTWISVKEPFYCSERAIFQLWATSLRVLDCPLKVLQESCQLTLLNFYLIRR
jgi:hypothetical protein